jgi:hypothetical protein
MVIYVLVSLETNGRLVSTVHLAIDAEWVCSSVLNAVAICITMQSMLASNKKKER